MIEPLSDKIDDLDKKILVILSQNARMPFKDVAELVGVSRAAVHQRVQRLKKERIIIGSKFEVNPISIGYNICAFVGIKLERDKMYHEVVSEIVKIPEIVEVHYLTGRFTVLIKLYAHDNAHLMDLLNNRLQEIPGVVSTETLISLDEGLRRDIPVNFASC